MTRWLLCWACFGLGDLVSRLPGPGYEYPVYNWLMGRSHSLQGGRDGRFWPWGGPGSTE